MEPITPPIDIVGHDPAVAESIAATRLSIRNVLAGHDRRLLVVVGPCSVHDVVAAREYARWLARTKDQFRHELLIVMRVYFEKPRTRTGWKGLINHPYLDGTFHINDGLRLARKLLLDINLMGVATATEFLDPVTPQYIADLISWGAIGARTSESQVHRELASGLSAPVGFKNGTDGNVEVAVNAVMAARNPHHFVGVTKTGAAAIVSTTGNDDCHVILRGGVRPNYDTTSIEAASRLIEARGLPGRVMVDCSHGNCESDHRRQLAVARDLSSQLAAASSRILGIMVEGDLVAGRQRLVSDAPLVFGQSVTDDCIDLKDTEALLDMLASSLRTTSHSVSS